MLESNAAIFHNSKPNNSSCESCPFGRIIKLIQILLDINILPKFGADWSIYADDRELTKSNVTVILNNGLITLTIWSQLHS